MVELKVSGYKISDEFAVELEHEITKVLQDTVSTSFAIGVGYDVHHQHHKIAKDTAMKIMPGWTMINVEECLWAWGGQRKDEVVIRLQTFLFERAVNMYWRREINARLAKLMVKMFSDVPREKLRIFNEVIEGEVCMYLPPDLFGNLLKGETEKTLDVSQVIKWMKGEIEANIKKGGV
jgi:hypothetical protein